MSVDWQCLFEDFVCPPGVSENLLKISVKVRDIDPPFRARDTVSLAGCLSVTEVNCQEEQYVTVCLTAC